MLYRITFEADDIDPVVLGSDGELLSGGSLFSLAVDVAELGPGHSVELAGKQQRIAQVSELEDMTAMEVDAVAIEMRLMVMRSPDPETLLTVNLEAERCRGNRPGMINLIKWMLEELKTKKA